MLALPAGAEVPLRRRPGNGGLRDGRRSAVTAIGTFASAVSRSQLVAGFVAVVIAVFLVTAWMLAKVADPPLKDIFSYMSLFDRHYRGFMTGKINMEDIVYFVSVAFVFLVLSSRFMAARRWR